MRVATSPTGAKIEVRVRVTPADELVYIKRSNGTLPSHDYKVIDLFSGAGGLTAGFTDFGGHCFKPVLAVDNDPSSIATYTANFGDHARCIDLQALLNEQPSAIPRADVVIGGPPCQGFSTLNRNRSAEDARRQMWRPYMEVVRLSGANIFVIENVPQLLDSPEFQDIRAAAEEMGFSLAAFKLLASNYGAPQSRKRAVIIGSRIQELAELKAPKRTHADFRRPLNRTEYVSAIEPQPWRTVRDAISDLPAPMGTEIRDIDGPENLQFGRNPTELSLKRYKIIPEGGNRFDLERLAPELNLECWRNKPSGGTDLFGRMLWDRPSVTIRTEFFKPEKGRYLHPVQHRPITHREAARLQGFDDHFVFVGSKIQVAKQIGNAVPVALASRIADVVYSLLVNS